MTEPKIILVIHNVRSAHNAGSLLRTADGLGVNKVYLTGYTPYPEAKNDERLPHIRAKVSRQIHKVSLGAEKTVDWAPANSISDLLNQLRKDGYVIAALEQTGTSQVIQNYKNTSDVALIVGNEVAGLDAKTLELTDICLEIPMLGKKESFNVAVAAAIALYHLRFFA